MERNSQLPTCPLCESPGWRFLCTLVSSGRGCAGASHRLLSSVLIKEQNISWLSVTERQWPVFSIVPLGSLCAPMFTSCPTFISKILTLRAKGTFFSFLLSCFLSFSFLFAYFRNGLHLTFERQAVLFLPLTPLENHRVGTHLQMVGLT